MPCPISTSVVEARRPGYRPTRTGGGRMAERTVGTTPPRALTIAGTDSGGGAGVAADLRAFAACGVHGCVAVTAVTVQNTVGVTGVHTIPPEIVAAQIEAG